MAEAKQAEWVKIKPAEVEKIIVGLVNRGMSAEKIGLVLRDQHGIPKVRLFGKRMSQILKENKIDSNVEKENILKNIEVLKKHFEKNKKDQSAKRSLATKLSRLRKFNK